MSSISDDDDSGPSLKELVTKNLESNGILGKLQAQLRASVFLILEEEFQEKNIPIVNEKAQQQLNTRMGKLSLSLVQDFLQCLNLEFTLAVFCPETKSLLTESKLNRQYLSKELGRNWNDNLPVLFQLIEESQNGPKKESENKDSLNGDVANPPKETPKTSVSGESISEKQIRFTKAVDDSKSESTISRIPSVVSEREKSAENLVETEEESISENENSHKELPESSESKNITKNESVHSVTNGVPKTSSDNSSSSSNSSSKNESSNQSTITSNHKSEKNTLSGMEKEYEEEFSSISEFKNHSQDDNDETSTNDNDETEEKQEEKEDKKESKKSDNKPAEKDEDSEIEEAVETAEDIEEDISSLDDLLSSNSETSNKTKDITASKENDIVDYEETL